MKKLFITLFIGKKYAGQRCYTGAYKFVLLFVFLCPLFNSYIFSQTELKRVLEANANQEQLEIDSLLKLVQITKNDTLRADLYFRYFELTSNIPERIKYSTLIIAAVDSALNHTKVSVTERKALLNRKAFALRYYYFANTDAEGTGSKKGIEQLKKAIDIFKETGNDVETAQSYVNLADDYLKQGNLLIQLQTLQDGLKFETDRKFNRGISRLYVQLQLFYSNLGDTAQALSYVEKALDLEKLIADPTREARGYYLAGLSYSRMGKHQKAIDYLLRSLESYKKENMQHKDRIGQTYLLLGDEYLKVKEYHKALTVYEEILNISAKANDIRNMFYGALAKGRTKALMGEYREALEIHNSLLKLAKEAEAEHELGKHIYKELALDYYHSGNYPNARKSIERAIQLSDKDAVNDLYDKEELAYRIDSSASFYEGAYKHYYQMNVLKKKLNKEEVAKSAAKDRFVTELNDFKKDQEKQDAIVNEEKQKQRIILFSVIGGLLLLLAFSIFVLKNLRTTRKQKQIIEIKSKETEEQKLIIEQKHKEITDSINYAERIQRSFIATKEILDESLNDYFVMFQPKDIVSGDFYWASKLNNGNFALATADSTGHGVPGAIMSLLNITSLEKAIETLNNPSEILNSTRKTIIERLKKDGSEFGGKDGMDASLTVYDFKNKKLIIAAANNPVWIVRATETIEIKADKMPVGKHDRDSVSFTQQQIDLQTGDVVYTLTDGYPDQFGGEKGKKFMSKNLRELLSANAHLPMAEQKQLLEKTFSDWVGNLEQVDDVTLIGVRI